MKSLRYVLMVLFLCAKVAQAEEVLVVAHEWEGYTNKDGSGYYFDLIRESFPAPDYQVKTLNVPFRRSIYMIIHGQADIILGAYPGDIPEHFMSAYPVESDFVDCVVSRKIAENWQGLKSLKNKKILAQLGYNFDRFFEVPVHYKERPGLSGMLRALRMGHVDAVLSYEADIKKVWKEVGLDEHFRILRGVIKSNAYFGFAEHSQDLKVHFNTRYKTLYQSGKLKELMIRNLGTDIKFPRMPESKKGKPYLVPRPQEE